MPSALHLEFQIIKESSMIGNRILNVLMVEDDEVDVMNVQRLFHRASLTNPLLIANNGRAAMSLIESEVIPLLGQQSDTPSKAGGLMSVTAPRAGELH
jgi:hypothetical protein